MNFILGVLVLGCLVVAIEVFRRQVKSDREFREYLERMDR